MEAEDEQQKTRGRFSPAGFNYLDNFPPTFHFIPTNSPDKSKNDLVNFSLYLQNIFSFFFFLFKGAPSTESGRDGIIMGPQQTDSWSSVVPSLCILTTVRDINDNLKGWLRLFSCSSFAPSSYQPHSKPNYCDFNHTVYE